MEIGNPLENPQRIVEPLVNPVPEPLEVPEPQRVEEPDRELVPA